MPPIRRRVDVIKEIPTLRKIVALLKEKFPPTTPSDRICAYYDPTYGHWHVACCSYFIWVTPKYKNWVKVLRKKYPDITMVFCMRYIVSSDADMRKARENKEFFFVD
jgi:hypothetical protein